MMVDIKCITVNSRAKRAEKEAIQSNLVYILVNAREARENLNA